jgi:transposase
MATTLFGKQAEQRRLRAMTLLDQGRSQSQVARMLDVTHAAVSQWVKSHRRGGDEALRAKPRPGAPPKLTARQLARLEKHLLRGPTRYGYTTELWTLRRVGEVIEKHFDVTYDPSGVWHVLNRMGWSCQKPEKRARERDEDAIVTWRKRDWPRIKKRATKR